MKTVRTQLIAMALLLGIGCAVGWHAGRYPLLHTIKTSDGKATSISYLLKSGDTYYIRQIIEPCTAAIQVYDPKMGTLFDTSRIDMCNQLGKRELNP